MIPKIIHCCWFSGEPFPPLIKKCMKSWEIILPEYEIKLWGPDSFDFSSVKYVEEAFGRKKWAFVTDYVRLHALYEHGGIYLDTDVEVLKPFDGFLSHSFFSALEFSNYKNNFSAQIEPAIMGATSGHIYIKECLDKYRELSFIKDNGENNYYGIPLIMTDILCRHGFDGKDAQFSIPEYGINLYPSSMFTSSVRQEDCYARHHYNGSWIDRGPLHRLCKRYGLMSFYKKIEILRKIFMLK